MARRSQIDLCEVPEPGFGDFPRPRWARQLPPPAAPPSEEDDLEIEKGLDEYTVRWREQLQPALGEIQLLASPEVADLAHGVTLALMDLADEVDSRSHYDAYYPISLRTNDLLKLLREAMRRELGVSGELVTQQLRAWPWARALRVPEE
jgi:hypothetical protein